MYNARAYLDNCPERSHGTNFSQLQRIFHCVRCPLRILDTCVPRVGHCDPVPKVPQTHVKRLGVTED